MKLSIIIPFYNSMPYFKELLDSLSKQDIKGTEIIFINDGSNDNYSDALSPFIESTQCAKLISTENNGVSKAKNIGLSHAVGEYVWFVDSDDIVPMKTIENIIKKVEDNNTFKPDIIFANFKTFNDNNNLYYDVKYDYESYFKKSCDLPTHEIDIMEILFSKININYSIWYQIFNNKFLKDSNITFDENLQVSEDLDFKFTTLTKAKYVDYMMDIIYIYRIPSNNRNSLSLKNHSVENFINVTDMFIKWYKYFCNMKNCKICYLEMKHQFAFLVYCHYTYIKLQNSTDISKSYINSKDDFIEDLYMSNKEYIDSSINKFKNNN